jgi:hypothetical protein
MMSFDQLVTDPDQFQLHLKQFEKAVHQHMKSLPRESAERKAYETTVLDMAKHGHNLASRMQNYAANHLAKQFREEEEEMIRQQERELRSTYLVQSRITHLNDRVERLIDTRKEVAALGLDTHLDPRIQEAAQPMISTQQGSPGSRKRGRALAPLIKSKRIIRDADEEVATATVARAEPVPQYQSYQQFDSKVDETVDSYLGPTDPPTETAADSSTGALRTLWEGTYSHHMQQQDTQSSPATALASSFSSMTVNQ